MIVTDAPTGQRVTMKNEISPVSLAYWFMDDGGLLSYNKDYVRKGLVFNTQGFTFQEVEILSQNLNKTYNLDTWVKENNPKPIIAVSGKKYNHIRDIIYTHARAKRMHAKG